LVPNSDATIEEILPQIKVEIPREGSSAEEKKKVADLAMENI